MPEMGNEMKGEHIMSFFDGYRREERARLTPGDYRIAITEVEEPTSLTSIARSGQKVSGETVFLVM